MALFVGAGGSWDRRSNGMNVPENRVLKTSISGSTRWVRQREGGRGSEMAGQKRHWGLGVGRD